MLHDPECLHAFSQQINSVNKLMQHQDQDNTDHIVEAETLSSDDAESSENISSISLSDDFFMKNQIATELMKYKIT